MQVIPIGKPVTNSHNRLSIDNQGELEGKTLVNTHMNEVETHRDYLNSKNVQVHSSSEFIKAVQYNRVRSILKLSKCGIILTTVTDAATLSLIAIIFIVLGLKGIKHFNTLQLILYLFWQLITIAAYIYLAIYLNMTEFNIFCAFILAIKFYTFFVVVILIVVICQMTEHQKSFFLNFFLKNPVNPCIYC